MTSLLTALTLLALMASINGEWRAIPFAALLLTLTIVSLLRK
jgi:hypothetical protein